MLLLALTQVALVGGWTLVGLEDSVNDKLKQIEASVDANHTVQIKDVQVIGAYNALITYEISDKK